jgi:hypothetical protein
MFGFGYRWKANARAAPPVDRLAFIRNLAIVMTNKFGRLNSNCSRF